MTSRGMQQMRCLPTSTGISSIPATKMSASGSSQQGRHQKSHSLFPGSRGRQFFPSALMRRNFNFPRSIWWSTTGCQSISSGLQCSMYNVQGFQNSIFKVIEGFQSYGRYCFEDTLQSFPRQTRYLHDHWATNQQSPRIWKGIFLCPQGFPQDCDSEVPEMLVLCNVIYCVGKPDIYVINFSASTLALL